MHSTHATEPSNGVKNISNSFQLLIDRVLNRLSFRSTLCYLDDVLIFSETFEQHMQDLQKVFSRFSQAGLKLSPQKCEFAQRKCLFLRSEISSADIHVPEDQLTAVSEYPKPKKCQCPQTLPRFDELVQKVHA